MYKKIARICGDDIVGGEKIIIGVDKYLDSDGKKGYKIVASNGDDVSSTWRALSLAACIKDINLMWGHWTTFTLRRKIT